MRDVFKAVNKHLIAPESLWAYNTSNFSTLPPCSSYAGNKSFPIKYYSVNPTLAEIKSTLLTHPILAGIEFYSSFVTDSVTNTGIVPLPNPVTDQYLGGHAILIYGYDDQTQTFKFLNSWGETWGTKGSGTLPYGYLLANSSLLFDLWYISK